MTGKHRRIWQRLGLGSYRGRYLWLTISLSLLLAGLAIQVQQLVRVNTTESTRQAGAQAASISTLTDASQQLHRLKEAVLAFILDPNRTEPERLRQISRQIKFSLDRLLSKHVDDDPDYQATVALLVTDRKKLQQQLEELIAVRLDANTWLPASQVMNEQMVPQASIIAGALQDIDILLNEDITDKSMRLQAIELQTHWQHILGEVRLLIANRFGIFSIDSVRGMTARARNLNEHLSAFRSGLQKLSQEAKARGDDFVLDDTTTIYTALNTWVKGYRRLRLPLDRNGWHQDLVLLEDEINPLIEQMDQRLSTSRMRLQANTQALLLGLLNEGEQLARGIGWLAAILIGIFVLGYLAYQRWLLRPIEHISRQLQREGRGEHADITHVPPVSETRRLVQSFSETREQIRARERRLDYMALHDPLTGLPNRVLFHERLSDALHNELPRGREVAVLFLDLDRFKQINDTHGHLLGDKFLVEVAKRLRATFRAEDLVARLSGDEFAVLLQGFGHQADLALLAQKVIDALA